MNQKSKITVNGIEVVAPETVEPKRFTRYRYFSRIQGATKMTDEQIEQEREAFEEWTLQYRRNEYCIRRNLDGSYCFRETEMMFSAWCARTEQAQADKNA